MHQGATVPELQAQSTCGFNEAQYLATRSLAGSSLLQSEDRLNVEVMGEVDSHGRGCHRYQRVATVGPQTSADERRHVWPHQTLQSTTRPTLRLPAWAMSRLRPSPTPTLPPSTRPLRVVAVGTLFLTHTLSLPSHPAPAQTIRAHEYVRSRGGSAPSVLCVLSQLQADKCWLVASLGGAQDARVVRSELEADGVSTRYCKVWEGAGVPAAWLLHAGEY